MLRWLAFVALPLLAHDAVAGGQCHVVDVDIVPADNLQIVAWVEKPDGTFVDTIYITQKTGLFGLGNRPGRPDFNDGPVVASLWPYGRRLTVFPVWSHRHGQTWPEVAYQNGDDNNLSHPFSQSSMEMQPPYCRPMMTSESGWDTATCASTVYTDKGVFSPGFTTGNTICGPGIAAPNDRKLDGDTCTVHTDCCSYNCDNGTCTSLVRYPPRADLARKPGVDSASVDMYKTLNPFDAVTHATPPGGQLTEITWPIPTDLPTGDYVMFVEVSQSFDFNATYNQASFPSPSGIPWSEYGEAYRGQPSVVYSVPFTISTTETVTSAPAYVGYGDPNGVTGVLHAPDSTITTDTPGTGASRLEILPGTTGDRVKVDTRPEMDSIPPGNIANPTTTTIASDHAVIDFTAPGSDGLTGKVTGYEIRYRANSEMTADNFADSTLSAAAIVPSPAGSPQELELDSLLPMTDYYVGIRAYDDCRNYSDVAIVHFTTLDRQTGEVDACFVATAAYGSLMANDVEMLRHFRDSMLRQTAFGELAVETYYTFGPPVAGIVGESELFRATARAVLEPIVASVKKLAY